MSAGMLDLLPGYVGNSGGRGCVDVLVILEEKVIDQLLHVCSIPIVNGCPCLLDDRINLKRVSGVWAWLVGCVWMGWALDCLHGLCALLLDGFVDGGLASLALVCGYRGLLGLLVEMLSLLGKVICVLLVEPCELYLQPSPGGVLLLHDGFCGLLMWLLLHMLAVSAYLLTKGGARCSLPLLSLLTGVC